MTLSEKTFANRPSCGIRTECSAESDRRYFSTLLSTTDDTFVFRRDTETGKYYLLTTCCEALPTQPSHA